jgi:hypothetical protein
MLEKGKQTKVQHIESKPQGSTLPSAKGFPMPIVPKDLHPAPPKKVTMGAPGAGLSAAPPPKLDTQDNKALLTNSRENDKDITHDQILTFNSGVPAIRPQIDSGSEQPPSNCLRKTGMAFSILLLVVALGYLGVSGLCAYDKRGKETYFVQDPTEVTFQRGLVLKFMNPTWEMKTDDWGYFYRAFDYTLSNPDGYWKDYDVFLALAITAAITGIMWIVIACIDINKFLKGKYHLAVKTLILSIVCLVLNIGGNVFVLLRVFKFYDDTKEMWSRCGCDSFKSDFARSADYYFYSVWGVLFFGLLQVILNIIFCCKRPKLTPSS